MFSAVFLFSIGLFLLVSFYIVRYACKKIQRKSAQYKAKIQTEF